MSGDKTALPLLQTKLHRPPVARDHLHRQHLLDRLDLRRHRPLTLVSAAAGYGKSTLASCWLESCDCPSAWVSLDEKDSDLRQFMVYFLAAIESMFPDAAGETHALLKGTDLPPVASLSGTLINELVEIDQPFILVLDDYHAIHDKTVHNLINELITHPPDVMHLMVVTRRDPPFPLAKLRVRGQMTEIRAHDLCFSRSDTIEFLQKVMGMDVDHQTAVILEEKTEGWVAGLRLAVLSFRERSDINRILSNLPDNNRYVMDYIIAEVVSHQPSEIKDYLLSTAILDRFCAPLCEAVCSVTNDSETCSLSGQLFIDRIEENNMFVIPLDDHNRWYRFHHLFRQLLRREMKRHLTAEQIGDLYNRAGNWFAQNDLPDEALQHFLAADNSSAAREIVLTNRHDLTNREQWHRLERWIEKLPADIASNDAELLLIKAWLHENRERMPELHATLEAIDRLLADGQVNSTATSDIIGECNALKSAILYMNGEVRRAMQHAEQAVNQIPRHHYSERAFAVLVWAFTHQMTGNINKARKVVYDAIDETAGGTYTARLLLTLCFIDWLEGDLIGLRQNATQLLKVGGTDDLLESKSFGAYHLGLVSYYFGETEKAREYLTVAVKGGQIVDPNTYVHGSCALALSYQAGGQPDKVNEIAHSLIDYALQSQNTGLLLIAKAFNAELALRQKNLAKAAHWANEYTADPLTQTMRFFVPQLTQARILLAQGSRSSHHKAHELLNRLHEFYTSINNKHCLIEVLTLKSMLSDAQGDEPAAVAHLTEALVLAEPGQRKYPFLDSGPGMVRLLHTLGRRGRFKRYIAEIMDAFERLERPRDPNIPSPSPECFTPASESLHKLDEPLTNRELDIVNLLAVRLSNKEIAQRLFISPGTVKRHTNNIYRKLAAHNRQEAVAKAQAFGLLQGSR